MAKKTKKETSKQVRFLMIMYHNGKATQIPFAIGMEDLDNQALVQNHVMDCFSDLVKQTKVNAK